MNLFFFLIIVVFSIIVGVSMIAISYLFGPKSKNPIKEENFECGMPQAEPLKNQVNTNFYTLAVVFLIFDIELILLYPWIWGFDIINNNGFWAGLVFCALILFTTLYVIKRKATEWE